ncbi:MAG: hypothetical protein M1812_004844 [Candelaria pacifica]|nr:MAG: hypothetical protein M1812_004844 [Candelaria pacifica]
MAPYELINVRHVTPPPFTYQLSLPGSAHSRSTSTSSFHSNNSSPGSVNTQQTTPERAPIRTQGVQLLPKVRTQDQYVEPPASPKRPGHRRAQSSTRTPGYAPYPQRPTVIRSTTSPPECISLISPTSTSASSAFSSRANSTLNSPISFIPSHTRKSSSSHSRSTSGSSLNDFIVSKYGYPTYRQMPTYIPSLNYDSSLVSRDYTSVDAPVSRDTSPFLSPATAESYRPFEYAPSLFAPTMQIIQPQEYVLPVELQYGISTVADTSTTMLNYLTSPNPTPGLVQNLNKGMDRTGNRNFWWDIRNLRSWSDFNLDTIYETPDFQTLLNIELPETGLPKPSLGRQTLQPDSESALKSLCTSFHATKVNAALLVAQGQPHIYMRPGDGRQQPDFVSNYQHDSEKTIFGNGHGRVVGLVKSFNRWNTGMRTEAPHRKVEYLLGLAHLHRQMREHGCRYGFIMTEIELVCVRAGTDDLPYFGFLEISPTIQMSTHGEGNLTTCLALWYLHMLAKEVPLPGQCGWRLDVGHPQDCRRQNVMSEKDAWIPDPQTSEKRQAKSDRGWIMPEDPLNIKMEVRRKKKWSK